MKLYILVVFAVSAVFAANPDSVKRLRELKQTIQELLPSGSNSEPAEEQRNALVELALKYAAKEGRETDLFVDSFKLVKSNGISPAAYESIIWDALGSVYGSARKEKRKSDELESEQPVSNKKPMLDDAPVRSSKQVQFSPVNEVKFFHASEHEALSPVVDQAKKSADLLPMVENEAREAVLDNEARFSPVEDELVVEAPVRQDDIIRKLERSCERPQRVRGLELRTKYLAHVAVDLVKKSDWASLGLMVDVFTGLSERVVYEIFRDAWLVMWGRETTFLSRLFPNQIDSLDDELERCMENIDYRARRLNDARVYYRDREMADKLVELVQNGQAQIVTRLFCLASVSSVSEIDRQQIDSMFRYSINSIRK